MIEFETDIKKYGEIQEQDVFRAMSISALVNKNIIANKARLSQSRTNPDYEITMKAIDRMIDETNELMNQIIKE